MVELTAWSALKTLTAFLSLGAGLRLGEARPGRDDFAEHKGAHLRMPMHGHGAIPDAAPAIVYAAIVGRATSHLALLHCTGSHGGGGALRRRLDVAVWTQTETVVYCKGPDAPPHPLIKNWLALPNIGCESHTYLAHIVRNYHQLADITFTHGRIGDSVDEFESLDVLLDQAAMSQDEMVIFRSTFVFNEWEGIIYNGKWEAEKNDGVLKLARVTPGDVWSWLFDGAEPLQQIDWVQGATFALNHRAIRRRPRSFYVGLLDDFEALNQTKPEEGHYMERFWLTIFGGRARPFTP